MTHTPNNLSVQLPDGFGKAESGLVERALVLAAKAHEGQQRKSGEPYITHPVAVAQNLADWGLDADAIVAGLLHDTVEDTGVSLEEIRKGFGAIVADLVDGVTKLGQVDFVPHADGTTQRQAISAENLRKLLLAMSKDLRVIVIKLADRLHNMQTLRYLEPEKQRRIARETLEIYAPLADRLGMGELKCQLEDLAFRYTDPEEYEHIEHLMAGYMKEASRYLARIKRLLSEELTRGGVEVLSIEGRQKHLYSVFKKLKKSGGEIDKIYDLIAVRILVPEVSDCYQTLGLIHQQFKPLIYRIKDYIAVPKPNGYRSLHTTVFALDGRITEIQIRTPQMHEEAERGLAAHFYYDQSKAGKNYHAGKVTELPRELQWVNQLADVGAAAKNGQDFVDTLSVDLFQDRIFVFSPKGDLYDLPEDSTPVDFAFAIHSDIGLRAHGAKINGKMVPLDTKLENRDVVEILTRREPAPNRDWLGFVRTPTAKGKIRAWFRAAGRTDNIANGRALLEKELKAWDLKHIEEVPKARLKEAIADLNYKDLDGLLAAIGEGSATVGQVTRRLFPPEASKPVGAIVKRPIATGRVGVVGSKEPLPYILAPCCSPSYPHAIVGYITRGSGVTVHRTQCRNLPDEVDRLVDCQWELDGEERLRCRLHITAANRIGLLSDLTGTVSSLGINISGLSSSGGEDGDTEVEMYLEVPELFALADVIKQIERLPGVKEARRLPR